MSTSSSVKYQVGGREVSQAEFISNAQSAVQKAISVKIGELLESRLSQIHCKEHDAAPFVTLMSSSETNLQFSVTGCCDALKARTAKVLVELGGAQEGR